MAPSLPPLPPSRPPGLWLRGYGLVTWALQLVLPLHLKRRLRRGKEHPDRWREKLGQTQVARPAGRLVWMHAVGLGEVLALRALIDRLAERPDLQFLVTSGTRVSGEVFDRNCPPRTRHQFLPLDTPRAARRFLNHWQPDLSIWAEQDVWPGFVGQTARRGIPLALVNARMNADAHARRARYRGLYADVLSRFALISAQDDGTARHLEDLGARDVRRDGSLKPLAPPLGVEDRALTGLQAHLADRFVWVVGSSHPEDEAVALAAHRLVLARDPHALLILAPRYPARGAEIAAAAGAQGLTVTQRSTGAAPDAQVYVADSFGELGLWYRLAQAALMGGTHSAVEGHNPWEPAALDCAVLHGPRTANFARDYADLDEVHGALPVDGPATLAQALTQDQLGALRQQGHALRLARMDQLHGLCQSLLDLIPA